MKEQYCGCPTTVELLSRSELEARESMDSNPDIISEVQVHWPTGDMTVTIFKGGRILVSSDDDIAVVSGCTNVHELILQD